MIHERLRSAYLSINLRKVMISQFKWADNVPDMIWFQVHGKALQSFQYADMIRIQKFIWEGLSTNHKQSKYRESVIDRCKLCQADNESEDHIIRCIGEPREKLRQEWLKDLQIFLLAEHTPDNVRKVILLGLKAWLYRQTILDLEMILLTVSSGLVSAYNQQTQNRMATFCAGQNVATMGQFNST